MFTIIHICWALNHTAPVRLTISTKLRALIKCKTFRAG